MVKTLLEYRKGNVDFFYSEEIKRDFNLGSKFDLEEYLDLILGDLLEKNSRYQELIEFNSKRYNLTKKAILSAHGDSVGGIWYYCTGWDDFFPVQDWINQVDGKYSVLLLDCCNPGAHEISAKKSAVLASNNNYSPWAKSFGDVNVELYLPRKGYIDSNTIDWEIEQLRGKLDNNG